MKIMRTEKNTGEKIRKTIGKRAAAVVLATLLIPGQRSASSCSIRRQGSPTTFSKSPSM